MGTERIFNTTIQIIEDYIDTSKKYAHLDIGPGHGALVSKLKAKHSCILSRCCDYTDELLEVPDIKVDVVDLNNNSTLPYENDAFDIITATEVIEHLEDFRAVLREAHRVLKPGGLLVISTPNILNIKSRLRNLWFGFAELMGPLPVHNRALESTAGHINPVSIFYVMHTLAESRYKNIKFTIDKFQRSGFGPLILLWLPIKLFGALVWYKEAYKYKTIDKDNKSFVKIMNSIQILLGRTIIVFAIK